MIPTVAFLAASSLCRSSAQWTYLITRSSQFPSHQSDLGYHYCSRHFRTLFSLCLRGIPLLIITHLHLRILVHWRILVVTFFARSLHALRARRILCARRRRKTRRWDSRRRNTSSHTRRSTKTRRRGKSVCGKSLLLRLAGLERRVVLAGHFGQGVALFFGIADFLCEDC